MLNLDSLKSEITKICKNYTNDSIGGWIFGNGPIPCNILFIGEAPGKTEIKEGKPFVGLAGKNFEKYLNTINLTRQSIRITNTCYFRPIRIKKYDNGKQSISNRTPKISEINLFKKSLEKEIKLVNPKIIITLGNTPLKALTNFNCIGKHHGKMIFSNELNKNIFPMYHPSSLTYNRKDEFKLTYEKDWLELKKVLDKI